MRSGPLHLRRGTVAVAAALLLGGCGNNSPAAPAPSARADVTPLVVQAGTTRPPGAAPATGTSAVRGAAAVAAHRRRLSRQFLALQDDAIALEAASRTGDRGAARRAWRHADALRAALAVGRSTPVADGLRQIAARLSPAGSPGRRETVALLARTLGDDAARLRRTRLTQPMDARDVADAPRVTLDLASSDLIGRPPAPDSELDALAAALGVVAVARPAAPGLQRARALTRRAAAARDGADHRRLAAAVGALLDRLAAESRGAS